MKSPGNGFISNYLLKKCSFLSRVSLSWTDEVQQTNAGGIDEDLKS